MLTALVLATQLTVGTPPSAAELVLMRLNPMLLAAACVLTGLLVLNVRRGSAYFWGGPISRADSPVLFWVVVIVNALLALGGWLGGLGFSVR